MRLGVTGLGVVSPAGVGVENFFRALEGGETAAPGAPHAGPFRIAEFGARQRIAPASLRRMPRLTQMTLVAAMEALAEARLEYDSTRVGVVFGTGLGTLRETMSFMLGYLEGGPEAASPLLFPSSVMNAAAGQLGIELGLRGVNTTINHRDLSGLGALTTACDLLELGRADALVVAAADELSDPALQAFERLGGLTRGEMRPYDTDRDGFQPGESAVALVVEREADTRRRGARVRALVCGRAETGESRPRVGWGRDASWPEAARSVALASRGLEARVGYVAGAGNGSALDERELGAVQQGLGGHIPPTSSILALTGECMSTGLVRVLAAIYALERQRLPGTAGLLHPLAAFSDALVQRPRPAAVDLALVASFAQGGANAAVVLGSGEERA